MTGYVHEAVVPGLHLASGPERGERFPVMKLDAKVDKLTPKMIGGCMSRLEPVVIKNYPKAAFSMLTSGGQYAPQLSAELVDKGTIIVNPYPFSRALGEFDKWIVADRTAKQSPLGINKSLLIINGIRCIN